MELHFYFEIRAANATDLEKPYLILPKRLFPEGLPDLPREQQIIYEGKVEMILFRQGIAKRIFTFLMDLGNPEIIRVKLTENGFDVTQDIYEISDVPEFLDDAMEVPLLFMSNIPWLAAKLLPKVRPGKTIKGIRRFPLPLMLYGIAKHFTKAV